MDIRIEIKNYRSFPYINLELKSGFTSFIGANNSGKSSLLKFFFEMRNLFNRFVKDHFVSIVEGKTQSFLLPSSTNHKEEIFCNSNNKDIEIDIYFDSQQTNIRDEIIKKVSITIFRNDNNQENKTLNWVAKFYLDSKKQLMGANMQLASDVLLRYNSNIEVDITDILQGFSKLGNTLYIGAFRNIVNVGSKVDYFDISIGEMFIAKWHEFKTGNIKHNNQFAINLTDKIKGIFGFESLEINSTVNNSTLQIIIDGLSYKLSEVGAGIAQFIIIFMHAALKKADFILIDEPELNLHPPLQIDFLTALASYSNVGVLFATHNVGLARTMSDRIYSVRKTSKGISEIALYEGTRRLAEFLGELSFSNYQDLEFDKILLVEGVTDVKTIQQFLRKLKKEHKIVVLPLGGTDLINGNKETELLEIKRICDDISALIDSELTEETESLSKNRKEFKAICEQLGIKCHILKCRAIENYFSEQAIKKLKGPDYKSLKPYQKLSELPKRWKKEENWRIAQEMTLEELKKAMDLGEFLESI